MNAQILAYDLAKCVFADIYLSRTLGNISLTQTLKRDEFIHIASGVGLRLRPRSLLAPRSEKKVWFYCEISALRVIIYTQTFLRGFN